jgi:hypothetical protein
LTLSFARFILSDYVNALCLYFSIPTYQNEGALQFQPCQRAEIFYLPSWLGNHTPQEGPQDYSEPRQQELVLFGAIWRVLM